MRNSINNIHVEIFLEKLYTFAFRLTGSEKSACILVETAINKMVQPLDLDNNMSEDLFKQIAKDICNIYINDYKAFTYETGEMAEKVIVNSLQRSILTLDPLNRITIIWKDVYSYKLDEIIPVVHKSYKCLQQVLSSSRQLLLEKESKLCNN